MIRVLLAEWRIVSVSYCSRYRTKAPLSMPATLIRIYVYNGVYSYSIYRVAICLTDMHAGIIVSAIYHDPIYIAKQLSAGSYYSYTGVYTELYRRACTAIATGCIVYTRVFGYYYDNFVLVLD